MCAQYLDAPRQAASSTYPSRAHDRRRRTCAIVLLARVVYVRLAGRTRQEISKRAPSRASRPSLRRLAELLPVVARRAHAPVPELIDVRVCFSANGLSVDDGVWRRCTSRLQSHQRRLTGLNTSAAPGWREASVVCVAADERARRRASTPWYTAHAPRPGHVPLLHADWVAQLALPGCHEPGVVLPLFPEGLLRMRATYATLQLILIDPRSAAIWCPRSAATTAATDSPLHAAGHRNLHAAHAVDYERASRRAAAVQVS